SPESTVAAQQLTAAERAATVASVWAEARYNFAYWDRVRADWDSGLVANLKLAAEPQSDLLFYRRLRRLVALLGDGRAAVIAPPTLRSRIARPPLLATESLPGGIAVVRIASLGDEEVVRQFDRAFPDFSRVQGLVLDLRRATDGKTEYANQILARLTDRPFSAVRWRTPQYRAVFRAWNLGDSATTWYGPEAETVAPNADRPSYGGPIAALVSSATAGPA